MSSTGLPTPRPWRLSVIVRIGAPGGGKLTAREASARPYTGYMLLRGSRAGASRVRNSSQSSTEIGSAPLKMSLTLARSRPSTGRSPSTLR